MTGYLHLTIAILAEVFATSLLKATEDFTKFWPSVAVVVGYGVAFYFLTLALRHIPIGIAYAVWAGAGIVLIAVIGAVVYKQVPDLAAVIGMALIVAGIVVIHLFSKTGAH